MFGQFCSISQRDVSLSTNGLTAVTFQQALNEYRDRVGGKRIRAIRFLYVDSCELLVSRVEVFFNTKFEQTTAGMMARFVYLGIPMTVTVHQRGIFRICEEF